jgi:hypothetical protein
MKSRITAADKKHREEFQEFVVSQSDKAYRPVLRRLYFLWETYAKDLLAEESMTPPYIMLASPSLPQHFGDYSPVSGFGGHSQIRIRPTLLTGQHKAMKKGDRYAEGRLLFVCDVLLHETIHQYHHEITGKTEDSYRGHGPQFRDTCNVAGKKLGLAQVRVAKARGKDKDLPSCALWPHCVRPRNYYHGAYVPQAAKKGAKEFDDKIGAKRAALCKFLGSERSGALVTLIEAAHNFRRLCPEDFEEEAAALLQGIDQRERRWLIGFLRSARAIDIEI